MHSTPPVSLFLCGMKSMIGRLNICNCPENVLSLFFSNIEISMWCLSCAAPPHQCDPASPWEQQLREQTGLAALLMRTRDRHLPRLPGFIMRREIPGCARGQLGRVQSIQKQILISCDTVNPSQESFSEIPLAEMSPWEIELFADVVKSEVKNTKSDSCSLQIVIYFYQGKKERKELKVIKRIITTLALLEMRRWSACCTKAESAQSLIWDLSVVYESALSLDIDIILRANSQTAFNKVMEILLLMSARGRPGYGGLEEPVIARCVAGRPAVPFSRCARANLLATSIRYQRRLRSAVSLTSRREPFHD